MDIFYEIVMLCYICFVWLKMLVILVILLLVVVVLGLLLGQVWMCIVLVVIGVLVWYYWWLWWVLCWLIVCYCWDVGDGIGVWNELDWLLYCNQLEMCMCKWCLLDMLCSYCVVVVVLFDVVVVVDCNSQCVQWFNEVVILLFGLYYFGDFGEVLVECLQLMLLVYWLVGGCNVELILDVLLLVDLVICLNLCLIFYLFDYWLLIVCDVSKLL